MSAFEYYKNLHQMPELSEKEFKTSQYIFKVLSELGYSPVFLGDTGVLADLITNSSMPWLLFRADIDALPIKENCNIPYASKHDGIMHACGHDAHTAMLLDAAKVLKNKKLTHNIRFVFQPAEETTTGAAKIIDKIIPKNLTACFAMHVWPQIPFGTVVTRRGALMASSDVFRIKFTGKSAHCSQQEKGNNALLSAVDMAHSLSTIKQSVADENTLLFCGSIHSGDSHNIVPDKAELYGTIRTYSKEHQNNIKSLLNKTANDIASRYGTTATLAFEGGCPPVYNSEKIVDILVNDFKVQDNALTTLAAEDFAYYGDYAPAVMLWLGLGDTPPLHNEKFFVPKDVLPQGVDFWQKIATFNWEEALN